MENKFIYLIGFGGTGKRTIACELQKLVPSILVDNQFINSVVFHLVDADGVSPLPKVVWDYTDEVRRIVLDIITNVSKPNRNFIFTNELFERDEASKNLYEEISQAANSRGAELIPVRLLISKEELCRRVVNPERIRFWKSVNQEDAALKWENRDVYKPDGCIDIQVDSIRPDDVAKKIFERLKE